MKYRFALLTLMAVSATPLLAQGGAAGGGMGMRQGGGPGGQGRGMMMMNINSAPLDQLDTWFKFTAEQKSKVDVVVKARDSVVTPMNAYRQQLMQQAMNAAGGGDATGGRRGGGFPQLPADSQTKLDAAQTKFRENLRSVLTGPQLPIFDSLVQAAGRRGGPGGGMGGARGARGGGGF